MQDGIAPTVLICGAAADPPAVMSGNNKAVARLTRLCILRMDMRQIVMLVVEEIQTNNDPVKHGDNRHDQDA